MANKSDTLRDRLADLLLEMIDERDPETGAPAVDARVLAVARAFVKDNPPEDLPTPESAAGLLDEHLAQLKDGKLPFASGQRH